MTKKTSLKSNDNTAN